MKPSIQTLGQILYTKPVLETLERSRGHKEPADLQDAQVEHTMPQTLNDAWAKALGDEAKRIHAEWLHRPGNLTLSAYNQELWNHPFERKRERYADSNIVLTRELAANSLWGEAEIKSRGESLAREATAIWIGPKEPFDSTPKKGDGLEGVDRHVLRLNFWTGLHDFLVENPDLPSFEPRPSKTLRLPSGVHHIGFELRHMLRPSEVAIDVYFWREASFPIWNHFQLAPEAVNALIEGEWLFERTDNGQPWRMTTRLEATSDDESSWPTMYGWFAEKLKLLYGRVAPGLREEMAVSREVEAVEYPLAGDKVEANDIRKRWWTMLIERSAKVNRLHTHITPSEYSWIGTSSGMRGLNLNYVVTQDECAAELYVDRGKNFESENKAIFDQLFAHKAEIEAAFGAPLSWERLEGKRACRIRYTQTGGGYRSPQEQWPALQDTIIQDMDRLAKALRPYLQQLKLGA